MLRNRAVNIQRYDTYTSKITVRLYIAWFHTFKLVKTWAFAVLVLARDERRCIPENEGCSRELVEATVQLVSERLVVGNRFRPLRNLMILECRPVRCIGIHLELRPHLLFRFQVCLVLELKFRYPLRN